MRKSIVRSDQGKSGFSLFEIVIAMAILGLIGTTVLSVLWQAGDTAAEIRYLDRRDEEINRFVILLRETIEGLPPEATLEMTPASETESGYDELKLENASTAFVFGETVGNTDEVYIALRPGESLEGGEPSFDLAISRSDFVPDDAEGSGMVFNAGGDDFLEQDDEGRYWLPLLKGVSAATWRFWDEEQQDWLVEWTDDEAMPPLMEFSLLDAGVTIATSIVFQVPERLVNPEAEEEASGSGSSGSSSVSSTQNRDGGGKSPDGDRRGSSGDRGDRGRGDRGDSGKGKGDRGPGPRPGGDGRGPGGRGPGGGGGPGGPGGGPGGGGQAAPGGGGGNR